jgi:type IV pilus assembly protein PilM
MAKRIVSIFVRDTGVHLLAMNGKRVVRWGNLPLEPGLVAQGVIRDETAVADKIKELLRLEKVGAGKVIAGMSGMNSLYRLITLPEMPDAILAEAVKREAKRVLPVSMDEVYLSFQPVPSGKGEKHLFLAAYPRNMTDAVVRTMRKAGLDPYLMDLAPLALARIPDEPRAIIINSRAEHADIIMIEERLPQLIRVLSLPTEAKSLPERLTAISEELTRTVMFYNSGHLEKPLDSTVPAFVVGELAEAPDSWPSLVGRFGFPVSLLPLPIEYPEGFPANDLMVNIGLALKELTAERGEGNFSIVNLNALPEVYLPQRTQISRILIPVGIIIGVGLLAFMGVMAQRASSDTERLRAQVTASEQSLVQPRQDIAAIKERIKQTEPLIQPIDAQIAQVMATTTAFTSTQEDVTTSRNKVYADMSTIVSLLPSPPQQVDLLEVNHTGDDITISGTAADEDYIFEYTRALRASGGISSLIITSIELKETTWNDATQAYEYKYKFTLLIIK